MDHFPIPTFPPDECIWVRVRKMCVECKGQKEKVAWSPSPHSIFFMSFSLLHISEVCLFTFASETWAKLPEKQIHCKFFPIFLHVNNSKTVPLPPSPLLAISYYFYFLLHFIYFEEGTDFYQLLLTLHDSFICHLTLKVFFFLHRIFYRGCMECNFCMWIWVVQ